MTTPAPEPVPIPSFADWLATYGNGSLDDKLSVALADVADAVRLMGKPGSITLTLKLTPQGDGIVVAASHAVKAPEAKSGQFFYLLPGGGLSRRDPTQPQIPGMEDADHKRGTHQ